mmetsp:Transcript_20076/g.44330  ORF Transcript_20076/g.44330 Transcript_20076/m.44330 type:complete len:87 (-) Transcript_20076:986-1246(-)
MDDFNKFHSADSIRTSFKFNLIFYISRDKAWGKWIPDLVNLTYWMRITFLVMQLMVLFINFNLYMSNKSNSYFYISNITTILGIMV